MKEQQNWASGRPKLENARKLRGTCFSETEDKKSAEIIEIVRKGWSYQPLLICFVKRPRART